MSKKPAYQDFDAWVEEIERLKREGKLKPVSRHLQAKFDSAEMELVEDVPPAKPKPGKKG